MWIQIHIDIDFTKLGATAFIISVLRLWCGAHLIHQSTADNVVEPLRGDAMTKNIKTQILHKSYEKKLQKQKTSEIVCEETKIWYKCPQNSQI